MRKRIDMTGIKINHWTVLEPTETRSSDGTLYWKCRCDCGLERNVKGTSLRSGFAKQCGFNCPLLVKKKINAIFDKKYVEDKNGCWRWIGYKDKGGYGHIGFGGEMIHRFSYRRFKGEIPEGLCVCHTCDVRDCVNPNHLWLGTTQENTADKISKGRQIRGEKIGSSKLKDEDILKIRKMRIEGKKQKEICEAFGISRATVMLICQNKLWKHIPLGEESKKMTRKY